MEEPTTLSSHNLVHNVPFSVPPTESRTNTAISGGQRVSLVPSVLCEWGNVWEENEKSRTGSGASQLSQSYGGKVIQPRRGHLSQRGDG